MPDYLAYTIFADAACTSVRETHQAFGRDATNLTQTFSRIKGAAVAEGDIVCACRIDRIGSETQAE